MRRLLMAAALASLVACGGGSDSPTGPSPSVSAPTLTTANTSIFIGQTVQFAATGGGTLRWGGDNPQVVTIDQSTGRVTGVGNGRVTIWAENEGGRTTRLLRGLPSFAGTWTGNWVVEGCTANGAFAILRTCDEFPSGGSRSLGLSLTQTDDRVAAGTIVFGSLVGSTTAATVGEDGQVRMTGSLNPLPGNPVRVNIDNVVLSSSSAGSIQGSLEQVWGSTEVSGTMRIHARIANLTRTSGGPALLAPRAPQEAPTLEDLIRLMQGK